MILAYLQSGFPSQDIRGKYRINTYSIIKEHSRG
jgi:hypothetical protein